MYTFYVMSVVWHQLTSTRCSMWADVTCINCMLVSATATDEVERLTRENAALREEVEQLKRELVAAEVQNGGICCITLCLMVIFLANLGWLFFPWFLFLFPSLLWCCWFGGRKGIWPVKNWVVGSWHGYLSGARCGLAYGPADATATHCLLLQ